MNDTSSIHPPLPPPRSWSSFFSGLIVLILGVGAMFLAQIVAVVIMVSAETMERGRELERADVMRISVDGDLLGIAFNWAKGSAATARDEYNAEIFYRFPLFPGVDTTLSYQSVWNPAFNTQFDHSHVFSLRLRTVF